MARLIYRFLSLLLITIWLISTSGVMVYLHHCQHKQEVYTSLFFDFDSMTDHPCSGCHEEEIPVSCCAAPSDEPAMGIVCHIDCCIESSILLRYQPSTEPVQQQKPSIEPMCLEVAGIVNSFRSEQPETDCGIWTPEPPEKPPLWGKQLAILYGYIQSDLIA